MKVISAVVCRQKTRWLIRVAQREIGVHHTIESAARANPLVERDACRFVCRRIETRKARIAAHRRYGATETRETVFVGASDKLAPSGNHVVDGRLCRRRKECPGA